MNGKISSNEKIVELGRDGRKLIQPADGFGCGTDSILLADFTRVKHREKAVDLGTGTGLLAILLALKDDEIRVDAIDSDARLIDIACRNVEANDLKERITVCRRDISEAYRYMGNGVYSLAVCNPPYFDLAASLPPADEKAEARTEKSITIGEIARSASRLLKSGGRLNCVYPAQKAFILMEEMRKHRLEPKRARLVQNRTDSPARLILIEAVKDGGRQLDWLPVLVLTETNGCPSPEYRRIYHMDDEI